jgi:uncharacterized protein YbjT (DUF2867 family)
MAKHILVVGSTGRLGRHFVDVLVREGHQVTALVRDDGDPRGDRDALLDRFAADGVKVVPGALDDAASLDRACEGVSEIVSCVDHRPDHLLQQAALAQAAARAGTVQRIIPSQFGIDSRLYGEARVDHGDAKRAVQDKFAEAGVPVTFIHTNGLAAEWVGSLGQLGLARPPQEEVEVYGEGETKFSTVAIEDVARFGVRALFDPAAANRHVVIIPPENLLSQNQLIALWDRKAGVRLNRRTITLEALDARIAALSQDPTKRPQLAMSQLVRAAWIDGLGDGRRLPDVLDAVQAYPDVNYVRASDYLDRYL